MAAVKSTTLQVRFTVDGDGKVKVAFADVARGGEQAAAALDRAGREADNAGRRFDGMQTTAKRAGTALGLALAAGATAAAIAVKHAIDQADEIRDLSIRLGTGTETLSAYAYAAKQTGTDIESLGTGLKILSKNAADALNPTSQQAKVFEALGVSVTDATGKLKPLKQLVPEIADKFKLIQDGTTKAALAQALFGRSGLELTEFLNQGSKGLQAYADKARELGIVISQETANNADDFNDTLGDLKATVDGMALQLASALLPELKNAASDLVELARNGDLASDAAAVLGAGFHAAASLLKEYENAVNRVSIALEGLINLSAGMDEVQANLRSFGLAEGSVADGLQKMRDANREGQAQLDALIKSQQPKPVQVQFITADSGSLPESAKAMSAGEAAAREHAAELEKRLAKALSNPSTSTNHDAERAAERLKKALEEMTSAEQAWQNELGKDANPIAAEYADRLRKINDEAEKFARDGVGADKIADFTEKMKALATQLRDQDIARFQREFDDETAAMVAQMRGPVPQALEQYRVSVRELDKALQSGLITQGEYNDRLAALQRQRDEPGGRMLQDLQMQLDLLGATNEQQDLYNRLVSLGVDANSQLGQAIAAMVHQLHEQGKAVADQVGAMDGLRDSTRGFFTDLMHGVGVWDALKKAADNFAARIEDIIANRATERLFGEQGSANDGASGGRLSGFFGSLFGVDQGKKGDSAAALSGAAGQLAASATPLYGAAAALETAAAALASATAAGGGLGGGGGGGGGGGWIGTLFSAFGSGWGSGGGAMADTGGYGSWDGALAAAFGGGRAAGGSTQAGHFYRVNENQPELLEMGGSLFLMMGGRNGRVLSRDQEERYAGAGGRGDTHISVTVPVTGRVDRRTRTQIGANTAQEIRGAMASIA
jgi:hypothetical protein